MQKIRLDPPNQDLLETLKSDCAHCCGLCCVALYYAKAEGFPADKAAGTPCKHLAADFRCAIHRELPERKLKGCLSYECFGAGQLVTRDIYQNSDWHASPQTAGEMFEVFFIVHQLCQIRWYLTEASLLVCAAPFAAEIERLIHENQRITALSPLELLGSDLSAYKGEADTLLKTVSEALRLTAGGSPRTRKTMDCFGKNLKGAKLSGTDFSMSLLVAANLEGCDLRGVNFLGADMRDTNLKNADLSQSAFLTQMQVNSAKGNAGTKLPIVLSRPASWLV